MADSYDILLKRVKSRGVNSDDRLAHDKLNTLEDALKYSYQAEDVIKINETVVKRALINNNKLKMDYDDKIISIPFDADFKVGDIFFWPRIKEYWIVYLRHYSEDAYFRGYIRRAQHKIKWEDEFGLIHECFVAVRGPVETKIKGEMKSGLAFDLPNYTLSIIAPNTEETKALKRYSKIALDGKIWEITVTDSISEPGVIDIQALEYYVNKEEDKEILDPTSPPNANIDNVKVKTSLDGVEKMELDEPFRLWSIVEQDGVQSKVLSEDARFTILEGSAIITENFLNVVEPPGMVKVELEIPKIGFSKVYEFETLPFSLPPAVKYVITGDENVRSYGKTVYDIKYFSDGDEATINSGEWVFEPNDKLFSILSNTMDSITFKWKLGVQGHVKLDYVVNGQIVDTKDIKVRSLI